MEYVERMGQSFYHYHGSFTTPPCTEGVKFLVMSEVQYITLADMETFNRFWGSNKDFAKGKGNNRVTLPLNDRKVYWKHVTLEER